MKLKTFFLLVFFLIQGCTTNVKEPNTNGPAAKTEVSAEYGYSPKNPVKVGAFVRKPKPGFNDNHRKYLSSLKGPNGEKIEYRRLGSCCDTKSKNAVFGDSVPLDEYELTYGAITKPLIIYINMYDYEKPRLPKGLSWSK